MAGKTRYPITFLGDFNPSEARAVRDLFKKATIFKLTPAGLLEHARLTCIGILADPGELDPYRLSLAKKMLLALSADADGARRYAGLFLQAGQEAVR